MKKSECKYCKTGNNYLLKTPTSTIAFGGQLHHGHVKIIYNQHVEDILDLSKLQQDKFWSDVVKTAKVVNKIFKPDRLNYELLGNWEPHLHWHIYPRYKTDIDWGQPLILHWKLLGERKIMGNIKMKVTELTPKQISDFKKALEDEFKL